MNRVRKTSLDNKTDRIVQNGHELTETLGLWVN